MIKVGDKIILKGEEWVVELKYRIPTEVLVVLRNIATGRHVTVSEKEL